MRIRFNNIDAVVESYERGDREALEAWDDEVRPFIPNFRFFPHVRNSLKGMAGTEHEGLRRRIFAIMKEMETVPGAWRTSPMANEDSRKWFRRWRAPVISWTVPAAFSTGLLPWVLAGLAEKFVRPTLIDERSMRVFRSHPETSVQLRDYQFDALKTAFTNQYQGIWWPRGIFYHATGAGKTETAAAMIQMAQVPTVFIVHRRDLLHQTAERLRKYGLDAGIVGDGEYDPRPKGVTVATVQTLNKKVWKGGPSSGDLGPLALTEQIFFDEAHLVAAKFDRANIFAETASAFTHAYLRWGLTATPGMRDSYSNLLLEGCTGAVLHTVRSAELIEKRWLTPPQVFFHEAHKVAKISAKDWKEAYDNAIVLNEGRNRQVVALAEKLPKPCLVLVSRVDHGTILKNRLPGAVYLHGNIESAERRATIEKARRGEVAIVIATTIFDEGVDIPELRSIIMAGAGKSQIKMLQRIGRGLRRAEQKNTVQISDFIDVSSATLLEHSEERMRVCKEEGFQVFRVGV